MKRVATADMTVIAQPKMWKGFKNWGIAALIGFAAASHLRAVAVLAVVSLASFLPGLFQIPPVDRDEPRFAQARSEEHTSELQSHLNLAFRLLLEKKKY